MSLIVQKYGGTSVGTVERIQAVAEKVAVSHGSGNQLVVAVSAMSGETNRLIGLANAIDEQPSLREMDVLVSTGEQVTIALLCMALQKLGIEARSYTGGQVRILTDNAHGKARIREIDGHRIEADLNAGCVVVVAGFQGSDEDGNITTLGRGGSDTTAVALAAALKADECQIYTDVDGVYTTDPRVVPQARRLEKITFEEMLEMASSGAKVLQTRSVAMAMRHNVNLQVRSSFNDAPGTLVVNEDSVVEQETISGIAYSPDEAKITIVGLPDQPGVAAGVFGALADNHVNVDMIVQSASSAVKKTDISFSVSRGDLDKAVDIINKIKDQLKFESVDSSPNVAKISVVGTAMRTQPGVAKTMFETLATKGVNLHVISTSEIKISVLIDAEYTELAVRSLHTAYGLDDES